MPHPSHTPTGHPFPAGMLTYTDLITQEKMRGDLTRDVVVLRLKVNGQIVVLLVAPHFKGDRQCGFTPRYAAMAFDPGTDPAQAVFHALACDVMPRWDTATEEPDDLMAVLSSDDPNGFTRRRATRRRR